MATSLTDSTSFLKAELFFRGANSLMFPNLSIPSLFRKPSLLCATGMKKGKMKLFFVKCIILYVPLYVYVH